MENSSNNAHLNIKWCSWFEGPDGSADYFNQDLIRYDSGEGRGVLCLCENPVVEPGLDPQTLTRHLTKHLLNLSETPSNRNFMSHLKNIGVEKLDSSNSFATKVGIAVCAQMQNVENFKSDTSPKWTHRFPIRGQGFQVLNLNLPCFSMWLSPSCGIDQYFSASSSNWSLQPLLGQV